MTILTLLALITTIGCGPGVIRQEFIVQSKVNMNCRYFISGENAGVECDREEWDLIKIGDHVKTRDFPREISVIEIIKTKGK
jgi:hypothetical protein